MLPLSSEVWITKLVDKEVFNAYPCISFVLFCYRSIFKVRKLKNC